MRSDDISRVLHRYWDQKIFSDVTIAADSIVGHKIYLHITLAARPKISTISYHGVKKSEREDIEERLGLRSGSQISPDIVDRAKIIIKRYFEEKGYKNAIIEIVQKRRRIGNEPGYCRREHRQERKDKK